MNKYIKDNVIDNNDTNKLKIDKYENDLIAIANIEDANNGGKYVYHMKEYQSMVELVERATPKKTLDFKICPNCKERVYDSGNYHHKCGQALDWTE